MAWLERIEKTKVLSSRFFHYTNNDILELTERLKNVNLTVVDIDCAKLTDQNFEILLNSINLESLTTLRLNGNKLTDVSVKALMEHTFPNLKTVSLANNDITIKSLRLIIENYKHLQNLETLEMYHYYSSDNPADNFADLLLLNLHLFPKLKSTDLFHCQKSTFWEYMAPMFPINEIGRYRCTQVGKFTKCAKSI